MTVAVLLEEVEAGVVAKEDGSRSVIGVSPAATVVPDDHDVRSVVALVSRKTVVAFLISVTACCDPWILNSLLFSPATL